MSVIFKTLGFALISIKGATEYKPDALIRFKIHLWFGVLHFVLLFYSAAAKIVFVCSAPVRLLKEEIIQKCYRQTDIRRGSVYASMFFV